MSASAWVLLAIAGGLGAGARYALDGAIARVAGGDWPWATFTINLTGAFALGLLVGAGWSGDDRRIAATGFLGAYTTFSTWLVEGDRLRRGQAAIYLAASLVGGLVAIWLGREAGRL